ncbi:MAG: hypothetical protein IT371_01045 [Deltaproteobacteria bacterium]|nr:hypothetical protein [Deltaproteobacteria bacterium]
MSPAAVEWATDVRGGEGSDPDPTDLWAFTHTPVDPPRHTLDSAVTLPPVSTVTPSEVLAALPTDVHRADPKAPTEPLGAPPAAVAAAPTLPVQVTTATPASLVEPAPVTMDDPAEPLAEAEAEEAEAHLREVWPQPVERRSRAAGPRGRGAATTVLLVLLWGLALGAAGLAALLFFGR